MEEKVQTGNEKINEENVYYLAKFGIKEHLKSLQRGNLYLNPVKNYRDDGTDYRGDSFEGAIPINPQTLIIKDKVGNDIFNKIHKNVIRKFGDYVLVFYSCYLLEGLRKIQKIYKPKFGFESGCIIYRDLKDFSQNGSYSKAYRTTGRFTDRYFVKGLNYKNQNEWRLILDGSEEHMKLNEAGGYIIQIGKIKDSILLDSETFLNTFKLIDDEK